MKQAHYIRWVTVSWLQSPANKITRIYIIGVLLSIVSFIPLLENTVATLLLPGAFASTLKICKTRSLLETKYTHKYGKSQPSVERLHILIMEKTRPDRSSSSSTDLRKIIGPYKTTKQFFHRKGIICSVICTEKPRSKIYKCRKLMKALYLAQQNIKTNIFAVHCIKRGTQYEEIAEGKANINHLMLFTDHLTVSLPSGKLLKQQMACLSNMEKLDTFPKIRVFVKLFLSSIQRSQDLYCKQEINAVQTCMYALFGSYHDKACKEVFIDTCEKVMELSKKNVFQTLKAKTHNLRSMEICIQGWRCAYFSHCLEHIRMLQLLCENKRFARTQVSPMLYILQLTNGFFDGNSYSRRMLIYKLLKHLNSSRRQLAKQRRLTVCEHTWLRVSITIPIKWISHMCQTIIHFISDEKRMGINCSLNVKIVWLPHDFILDKRIHCCYNYMRSLDHILLNANVTQKQNVPKFMKALYVFMTSVQYKRLRCVKRALIKCHVGCAILNVLTKERLTPLYNHESTTMGVNSERQIVSDKGMPVARRVFIAVYIAHKGGLNIVSRSNRLCAQTPVNLSHAVKIQTFVKRCKIAILSFKLIEEKVATYGYVSLKHIKHRFRHADSHKYYSFLKDILIGDQKKSYLSLTNIKRLQVPDYFIIKRLQTLPKLFVIQLYSLGTCLKTSNTPVSVMISKTINMHHARYMLNRQWINATTRDRSKSDKKIFNKRTVHPEKMIYISMKCVSLASGLWSSRFANELTAPIAVRRAIWLGEKALIGMLTFVNQCCDEYKEEISWKIRNIKCWKLKRKDTTKQHNGLHETEGTRTDLDKIRQNAVNIVHEVLEKSTALSHSGQHIESDMTLTKIIRRFSKFIGYARQVHTEHGVTELRRSRDTDIQESPHASSIAIPPVVTEHDTITGTMFRTGTPHVESAYTVARDIFINKNVFRSIERSLTNHGVTNHNVVTKQEDSTSVHNNLLELTQIIKYASNHEKETNKVLLYAGHILKMSGATGKKRAETKRLKRHSSTNSPNRHFYALGKYLLIHEKRLTENNTLHLHKQVRDRSNKRHKRQGNFDNDSLIRIDLMTDLRSKWLDMKEDVNKLQEKIYDAKERISNVEEDLKRLIRRGDMLAKADVKITNNDKLKNAMVQADWKLIQLEFRALKKEILRLQKQTERRDKYKLDKKEERQLRILKNSLDAKKAMIDKAVQNILNLDEQKLGEKKRIQVTDSGNNNANDYSNFEEEDISNQLNVLGGFSQGGRYYDPSLEHVDGILKTFLSRTKRATAESDLQRSSDAALLAVNNLQRERGDNEGTDLNTLYKGHLTGNDTSHLKSIYTDSADITNVAVKMPFFESLEDTESFLFFYPKSTRKTFVKEWWKLKRSTRKLLRILNKIKRMYSRIQAGIRNLKKKGKSMEIKIVDIIKSNDTISRIFHSRKWKMIWKDIQFFKKEINKYNKQVERYDVDMFLQNITEKIELIQKKLDTEKSLIENKLYSGSNPHTLLPFSIGSLPNIQEHPSSKTIHPEDKTHSPTGNRKDIKSDIMLEKLEKLIVYPKQSSPNSNMTNVENTLNNLIMEHAADNGIPVKQLDDVNSPHVRVKRRGANRRRRYRYNRRYYDNSLGSDASWDDPDSPEFFLNALGRKTYVDDIDEKPLEKISMSSLYNDFLDGQTAQQTFGDTEERSDETLLPLRGLMRKSPEDIVDYLTPISEGTSDGEISTPRRLRASFNISASNYPDHGTRLEQKNQEDTLISSHMKDLLNEIDSSNIAESMRYGNDIVTKREAKNEFLTSINQLDKNNRARGGLYQTSKPFRHDRQRGETSQDNHRDINQGLQDNHRDINQGLQDNHRDINPGLQDNHRDSQDNHRDINQGLQDAEHDPDTQTDMDNHSLNDIIDHDLVKAFHRDLSLSTATMSSADSKEADKISADILRHIEGNNMDVEKDRRQNMREAATKIKEFKNAQKMETEALNDFETFQDRLMRKHLKETAEVANELKQAVGEQEKKDIQLKKLKDIEKKIKYHAEHMNRKGSG